MIDRGELRAAGILDPRMEPVYLAPSLEGPAGPVV